MSARLYTSEQKEAKKIGRTSAISGALDNRVRVRYDCRFSPLTATWRLIMDVRATGVKMTAGITDRQLKDACTASIHLVEKEEGAAFVDMYEGLAVMGMYHDGICNMFVLKPSEIKNMSEEDRSFCEGLNELAFTQADKKLRKIRKGGSVI